MVVLLLLVGVLSRDPKSGTQEQSSTVAAAPVTTSSVVTSTGVAIPTDLVGKNPKDAKAQLAELGFRNVVVESVDGRAVVVESNWRVVTVDGAGSSAPTSAKITLRVEKPAPPTTTTQPPLTTRAPEPAPPQEPAPEPKPQQPDPPAQKQVYYASCDQVRAAGAAPLHRGQPGYRSGLDRDNDGVACEK
ncbi:excalibur calcium-binding domain-containing protein [Streptoalloteichus hindustanus]|uniref:excalibur calcium-binding domain-containing protein n=1 Tax=Streptoalloteichus hindustanus TaxID=2017 RepID=UPI000935D955|nr:excalibur calcium-binding domain-containing protein [Streptoalloteichus hindustanus]